jgi:formylglycine-generating enzyme required for sulfatase activity
MHPKLKAETGGRIRYTPAYDALLPYVRRVSIEDDVSLLIPGEYHADTSELIQLLRAGHYGVELDTEAWDRLITWIDLNAPCHGTWSDVHQLPTNAKGRRAELRRLYGPPPDDPETVVPVSYEPQAMSPPKPAVKPVVPKLNGWPFDADEAKRRQTGQQHTVDLGGGVRLDLAFIPAGTFVMGSADGCGDEAPPTAVTVGRPFWMGTGEVTNEQFRRFDPGFDPRYYARLHARSDDQGLPLDGATQPAIRVSWHQAMAYCIWLSERTGRPFTLPTEAQWEWACRAGTETPLNYGKLDADFSKHANVADRAYADVKNVTGGLAHLIIHGQALCDARFTDRHRVTAPVGSYQPNAWGLHDLHGNAAEWTLSLYRPYPYADDGRNGPSVRGRRVVRGGSFFERPKRCRSSARLAYPPWQRVFNVGFRVVCLEDPAAAKRAGR